MNYTVPLELTKYLKNETDYLPWHRVISSVTYLANMLEDDTNLYPRFQVMKQKKTFLHGTTGSDSSGPVTAIILKFKWFSMLLSYQYILFVTVLLKKSAENCLVLISELPGFSIQDYALRGKKLCLIILIIHHHKSQYRHLLVKAVLHPVKHV